MDLRRIRYRQRIAVSFVCAIVGVMVGHDYKMDNVDLNPTVHMKEIYIARTELCLENAYVKDSLFHPSTFGNAFRFRSNIRGIV